MRAKLAILNHCAVPFLSRAAANMFCYYYIIYSVVLDNTVFDNTVFDKTMQQQEIILALKQAISYNMGIYPVLVFRVNVTQNSDNKMPIKDIQTA